MNLELKIILIFLELKNNGFPGIEFIIQIAIHCFQVQSEFQ